ncbi:MAG: serine/threonine protein kinase [Sandaracinaceae bacterium]|nr:serine/threonine protein kinase [Sandaracinaceae bacterium]
MTREDPNPFETSGDDTVGRLVDGRYRVRRVLGQGGLGRVYAATDERLGREVAVKVLLAEHAETPSLRARFEREARALSALSHPNIVTITDFGLDGERAFVVMELLPGQDLSVILSQQRLGVGRALHLMRGVLAALSYAHALQIVHRDLKPSNVMVRVLPDGTEHVAVLDFGLAKFLDEDEVSPAITTAGAMMGTPAYMSPEQACGVAADARSDVYSAGLLLYELLAGRPPFTDCTGPELLRKRLVEPPPPLAAAAPELGDQPELQAILDRALAAEVKARYVDAGAMLQALDALPAELLRHSGAPLSGSLALPAPSPARALSDTEGWRREPEPGALTVPGTPRGVTSDAAQVAPVRASRSRLWLALAAVLVVGALGVGVVTLVLLRTWLPDTPVASAPAPAPAVVPAPPPPVVAPPVVRPAARNPWRPRERLDEQMKTVYDRLERGSTPSRQSLRRLAAYAANHPTDPRPRLLLARAFEAQGWLRDALPELERALVMDPSVRGDPHVLPILMRILESPTYHEGAAALIRTHYGEEARPAVRSAMVAASRPETAERLRAFEASL